MKRRIIIIATGTTSSLLIFLLQEVDVHLSAFLAYSSTIFLA